VIAAAAAIGWALALVAVVVALAQHRRLQLVADADHELRGPVTALALGVDALACGPGARDPDRALATELERLRGGLEDLAAARRGIRRTPLREPVPLHGLVSGSAAGWAPAAAREGRELVCDWRAGPVRVAADRGRLAQLFGNLIANAVEHGGGRIELRGERRDGAVRIEVRDEGVEAVKMPVSPPNRGRGLRISRRAAAEAGGRLNLERDAEGTQAAVELPLSEA
jgi:two-component system, OmpR family, sensor histidine kinase MtrB